MWKQASKIAIACMALVSSVWGQDEFGYTASSSRYVIHSGNGLTISMARSTCDVVSILYKGQELQYKAKYTHINSGLKELTSSIKTLDDGSDTIQITCEATGITQYYFFRPNENVIYMGTYHDASLALPELRFLARLDRTTVATGIEEATLDGTVGAIEAHDVYAKSDNTTRSKFYSGRPFIHDQIHGVRGDAAGVYFVISEQGYESSSSGPFFRDINNQCTEANELTFYMNSDHTRTEEYRCGFHGPYALMFTDGPTPASPSMVDFDFFQDLTMTGFVNGEQRGEVHGSVVDPNDVLGVNDTVVVGFANANAQYWTELAVGERQFMSPLMKEGTYTMVVYKKQLVVASASVNVDIGNITVQDIQVSYTPISNVIWQIGEWDGTPEGFLNADKIHSMHPSDARMAPWEPLMFNADSDEDAQFPLAQFRGVNDPLTIQFNLTEEQTLTSRTLNIGVTFAQGSARPSIRVNDKWSGPVLTSGAVKTRGVTRGVTTGNYMLYEYTIPVTALAIGTNRIALGIASGTTDPAEPFLHAAVVFDALALS
uniref:rhamnogalacturonan endolyase n=1 Tax=Globisporangium ultimum (strain ATCC 200006 / CBS 805.95 / DAOM BR144) TaxID=431595 RepID=K3WI88_GLOUD